MRHTLSHVLAAAVMEMYPDDYANYLDYRFDVMNVNMSVNGIGDEPFILLPTFTIMAEGDIVHSGVVTNEIAAYTQQPMEAFYDDYALNIDYIYSAMQDEAGYVVGDAMDGAKFSDYDGVAVFDNNNKPNEDYFVLEGGQYYLISSKGASTHDDSALYLVTYQDDGQFQFVFNGGDNFLQIDFSYFGIDSVDIYDPAKADSLTPQAIDLVTLSIWT